MEATWFLLSELNSSFAPTGFQRVLKTLWESLREITQKNSSQNKINSIHLLICLFPDE